jgi:hypothetical protein
MVVYCAHCLRKLGRWHKIRRALRLCNPPEPHWVADVRAQLRDMPPPPPPRQLRASPATWAAIRSTHRPSSLPTPAVLGDLSAVPVVVDPEMPDGVAWRFVNPSTGEVLHEQRR